MFSIVVANALNEDQTIAVIDRNTRSPLEMILQYSKELETRKSFIEYSLSACIQRTIMCNLSKDLVRYQFLLENRYLFCAYTATLLLLQEFWVPPQLHSRPGL
jgi:hypothetical protein